MPTGRGDVNAAGIEFYSNLINTLLKNDIEPWVTLFHWDYPYSLFLKGGWLNPKSPDWFAEYTKVIMETLGDRVKNWITFNEPQCFIGHGHHGLSDNTVHAHTYNLWIVLALNFELYKETSPMDLCCNIDHNKAHK